MPDLEPIKEAIGNITALYALLLGARREKTEIEVEVNRRIIDAKMTYEDAVRRETVRVQTAQVKIDQAAKDLQDAQEKAFKDLGIEVRLEPERTGSHTRL